MEMIKLGFVLAGLVLCASGCAKKQEAPRRTEPWLASASASASASAAAVPQGGFDFRFGPESSIRFSLSGRKAKLRGTVPLVEGKLRLDPSDLKASTASLDADLTRISIAMESMAVDALPADGGLPTGPSNSTALEWLELGPEVAEERRAQFARARFELVALENLSAPAFDLGHRARPDPVGATAVGTLLLHGYRAPVRVEILLQTLPPSSTSHFRLSIRSTSPLVLPLAPHDIVARAPSGTPDPLVTARAEGFVGKSARIEFELVAEATN